MLGPEGDVQDPIQSSRRYKSVDGVGKRSDTGPGSMADKASPANSPQLTSNSSKGQSSPGTPTKNPGQAGGDLAKKAATDAAAKKSISKAVGKSVGKGLTVKGDIDDVRRTAKEDGAAAAAAAAGLKAAETVASKVPIAAQIAAGIRAAQAALAKVGINIKDQYIMYMLLLIPILALVPIIVFTLVVFFAWKNPQAILKLSFTNFKTFVGAAQALVIDNGGASKLAYEVDAGSNRAVAAPNNAAKPAEGTYEYLLAQIDWEKAKYQTLPLDSRCEIKTKKVVSVLDGKERSVIESVQLKTNPGKELQGIARANCINNVYPIWNAMMRSQFVRDGVNASLNVRYAYAEPKDSETLQQPSNEFSTTLRDKTLTRIWNKGGSYNKPIPADPNQVAEMDRRVEEFFFDRGSNTATRKVNKYTVGKYSQEIVDCANNFIPPDDGGELDNFYQKNIDKMQNDLKCGIEPKDLLLYTTMPDESTANNPDTSLALRPRRAALNVVCDLYTRLLKPEIAPVENYKLRIKDRINSSAVAAWQAMTYADTHQKRFIDLKELGGDFYKIAGMQGGQEYNYALDYRKVGVALEPDAISRVVGYYNQLGASDPTTQAEQKYIDGLNAVFSYVTSNKQCDAARSTNGLSGTEIAEINDFWENVYPKFKQAMAGIDFYSRPEKSQSISQIYNNLTYEDIFFRMIRLESNVATAGTEDGAQNFNRMNFGMRAYTNAFSLAMGGKFLTQNEATARDQSSRVARAYDDQTKGLSWRFFNLDNPSSFASRLAVATIDRPQNIPGNVGGTLASVFSPIRNAAGESGTLTAFITGTSRTAQAATSVYEKTNLKLDPAGMPEVFNEINPIENARFIENLKKTDVAANAKFSGWDQCFREFIPSRFHLIYPTPDKKVLYDTYCRPLFDSTSTRNKTDLAVRYSAYHFHMQQAAALVFLSNPNKEDPTFSAQAGTQPGATPSPAPGAGGAAPPDAAGDTTALQCPAGTTDKGTATKYGPGKVPQYNIRLCDVQGITVNVSVAANLNALLTAAKAAGFNLGGGGFRSYDKQVELRVEHGCPDPNAPSSSCSPPTAQPGKSNHEGGEAVDFNENGNPISAGAFNWLKANAQNYYFFNLPSERWHWSKDGR